MSLPCYGASDASEHGCIYTTWANNVDDVRSRRRRRRERERMESRVMGEVAGIRSECLTSLSFNLLDFFFFPLQERRSWRLKVIREGRRF